MTIKFYPSRLPGEPLETHEHGVLTLHEWMAEMSRAIHRIKLIQS
jgi:hypothetical protein